MSKRRINVRGIVKNIDDEILSVKHRRSDGSTASYWATPGGGLDPYESIEDGLRREFIEELGVEPQIGRLLLIQQFKMQSKDSDEQLEMFFEVTNVGDFSNIELEQTSHGKDEIAQCEFIDATKHDIRPGILASKAFQKALNDPTSPAMLYNEISK